MFPHYSCRLFPPPSHGTLSPLELTTPCSRLSHNIHIPRLQPLAILCTCPSATNKSPLSSLSKDWVPVPSRFFNKGIVHSCDCLCQGCEWGWRTRRQAIRKPFWIKRNFSCRNSNGVNVRSIWSAWCWLTKANLAWELRLISPTEGSKVPMMSFTSVVFCRYRAAC